MMQTVCHNTNSKIPIHSYGMFLFMAWLHKRRLRFKDTRVFLAHQSAFPHGHTFATPKSLHRSDATVVVCQQNKLQGQYLHFLCNHICASFNVVNVFSKSKIFVLALVSMWLCTAQMCAWLCNCVQFVWCVVCVVCVWLCDCV